MAQLKRTFLKGRMNQDLDERLLPTGEYFDATNIQVSTSEGSDVGAIETVLGNTLQNTHKIIKYTRLLLMMLVNLLF